MPSEVIRFSFQRFQDHFIAESILNDVTNIHTALADNGVLSFLYRNSSVVWQWQGLIHALSVQIPERYSLEFVDLLPGEFRTWWRQYPVYDAFMQSVLWRSGNAFSTRTQELLNRLEVSGQEFWGLLITLAASVDHPWNAEMLHRNLVSKKMPRRDAWWSLPLNDATDDDTHPINRLINWCFNAREVAASLETLRLCAIVLCWCFTSSSRPIRDRATKALTTVLLVQPSIYIALLEAFTGVDDLYVWERLYAAGFGACCLDPTPRRLVSYAQATLPRVFIHGAPPDNILLRDYARGIVELANQRALLPPEVEISRCCPPYKSSPPRLSVTTAAMQQVEQVAGGDAISHSCCDFVGDFGRYEIEPPVTRFAVSRLSDPPPYSRREIFELFEEQVIDSDQDRLKAWTLLQNLRRAFSFRIVLGNQDEVWWTRLSRHR